MLSTDIAAYFECVREEFLEQMLIGYGVDGAVTDALANLLRHWNRASPTGLPQGVWPSDYLGARLYLDRVDDAMNLLGYRYFRYSDDIRIAGDSLVEIRRALRDLVIELRSVGLQVQAAKTRLMTPKQVDQSLQRLHERLVVARRDELAELLDLEPYAYEDPEEALEELTEGEILESEPLLEALLDEAYGDGSKPDFELCRTCISGYRRIRSAGAAKVALDLLEKLPALTSDLVRYLLAVDDALDAKRVATRAMKLLFSEEVIHPWQRHWLLRLLSNPRFRVEIGAAGAKKVFGIGTDRNEHWAVRAQAIRLTAGLKEEVHCRKLKELYPEESNPDVKHAILLAIARLPGPEKTGVFRMAKGADPVTDLVISDLLGKD